MKLIEKILGFDAKILNFNSENIWTASRIANNFVNKYSNNIFSVDEFSWPSVFYTHQCPGFTEQEKQKFFLTGPKRPNWIGPNNPLWENLNDLKNNLIESGIDITSIIIIAVTCCAIEDPPTNFPSNLYLKKTDPETIDENWEFLGYDIADSNYTSSLTNCGTYSNKNTPQKVKEMISQLNENNLFNSIETAMIFRDFSDKAVTEHSPFVIYGLYSIL